MKRGIYKALKWSNTFKAVSSGSPKKIAARGVRLGLGKLAGKGIFKFTRKLFK
ncbi:hypothetical protein J7M28_13565 [bacterium]|nr:hypothetical protein [bacterium]